MRIIKYLAIMVLIPLAAAFLLSGCAIGKDKLVGAGSAYYEYEKTTADGTVCHLSVVSGRDVIGANIDIGQDCTVQSRADSTSGAKEALQVVDHSIQLGRELAAKAP